MKIRIETRIAAPLATVWKAYVTPDDIVKWNAASDDWHTTRSTVDLKVGGNFSSRMEAKDGSFGFDMEGTYTEVVPEQRLAFAMPDGRQVAVDFVQDGDAVVVTTVFDAEDQNPAEMQQQGWQAILDNFGRHVLTKA
ncbi:SRPBCC family protein [Hydrogenophaga sp. 5NK40-0174]|uniref:SRPBCC family protein n=1 Tax=Hydrogenophaga sp. 5NK40-0174 TaxID=3127649 RepID=UPI00310837DA